MNNMKLVQNYSIYKLIILVLIVNGNAAEYERYCPRFCKCDLFNGRNRADCSAKRLINPTLEISPAVEILDLSYNDITNLDNSCFKNYYHLIELLISHNAIHTIDLDAFRNIPSVTGIDLSYNRLEYLDERLFETNKRLHTLNLEGNKFMSPMQKPLIWSNSLRVLNLRNSQFNYISSKLFSGLTNLEDLDLSQNLLITIEVGTFDFLQQLHHINLVENPWNCDETLFQVMDVMQTRDISVELEECKLKFQKYKLGDNTQMFERMELETEETKEESLNNIDDDTITNSWRPLSVLNEYEDRDGNQDYNERTDAKIKAMDEEADLCLGSRLELCKNYHQCLKTVINNNNDRDEDRNFFIYTNTDLGVAFLLGAAVGITCVIFLVTSVLCFKTCVKACKKTVSDQSISPHDQSIIQTNLMQYVPTAPPTMPEGPSIIRPTRRSRRRQAPRPPNHLQYHYHEIFPERDNFFTRLFGRPARRQYYRTLNQNTATLIRRLSRSNLFNNRHFGDRNGPSTPSTPTTPTQFEIDADNEYEETSRSETPPPTYVDVVVNCEQKHLH